MRHWLVVGFSLAFVLIGAGAVEAQNSGLIRFCQINKCGTPNATRFCGVQSTNQCRLALAQQRITAQIVQQFLQAAPPPTPGPTAALAPQPPPPTGSTVGYDEDTGVATFSNTSATTLSVTGNAAVGGTLTVSKSSTFGEEATFVGGVTVHNHLQVGENTKVDMGGNRVQNVALPIAGTDAANKDYVDAGLGAAYIGISDAFNKLNDAFKKIDENSEGIAVAIALGGIALPQGKNFALAGNVGVYDDKQAAAAQAAIRVNETLTLNAGVGVGFDNGQVGGRVGFMAAW